MINNNTKKFLQKHNENDIRDFLYFVYHNEPVYWEKHLSFIPIVEDNPIIYTLNYFQSAELGLALDNFIVKYQKSKKVNKH